MTKFVQNEEKGLVFCCHEGIEFKQLHTSNNGKWKFKKQRSCREFRNNTNGFEENDHDVTGRSTRHGFSGKPSSSSVVKKRDSYVDPGRLSLDENTLQRSSRCSKNNSIDSESDNSSLDSPPSWRRVGRVVSSGSHWALSPLRSGSPHLPFSNSRPQHKSVEKILSMGFDIFKTKKPSNSEAVHQLRLLDNRLVQWQFANARAHAVNHTMSLQTESNLICALDGLAKLRYSVVLKKIELQREKLEMKLNFVLHSQMKLLKTWGSMKRQHLAAITVMKECLYSVACQVLLLEGAKVDIQLASIAQRHAFDLTDSIKSVLSTFSPLADKTAELLSELAEVVAQEKFLLEEFNDIFHTLCVLELQERSLMCSLIQLKC
ncbi:QWRF motif-containing protein 3 [Spatholobus suberectus]|nr:QWRF motif-containing protein 3 [Spatholobus suberectus]